jgi:DNA-binding response OmpR family regulator
MLCRALLLTKPFLPKALREAVSAALGRSSDPVRLLDAGALAHRPFDEDKGSPGTRPKASASDPA